MMNRDDLQLQSTIEDCLRLHVPRAPSSVQAIFRQYKMLYAQDIGKICNSRPEMTRILKEQISTQTIPTIAVAVSDFIDAAVDDYKVKVLRKSFRRQSSSTNVAEVQDVSNLSRNNDLISWIVSKNLEPNEYLPLSQAGIMTLSSLLLLHESQLSSLSIKKVPLVKLKRAIDEENGLVRPSIPLAAPLVAPPAPPFSRGISGDMNGDDSSDPLTMTEVSSSINLLRHQREIENSFLTKINSIILEERSRFTAKALEVLMSSKADHQDRSKRLATLITDKTSRGDTGGQTAFRFNRYYPSRYVGVRFISLESPPVGYAAASPRPSSTGRGRPSSSQFTQPAPAPSSSSSITVGRESLSSNLELQNLRLKESQRLEEAEETKRNQEAIQLSNGGWRCNACTLINDRQWTRCHTCNTSKFSSNSSGGGRLEVSYVNRPSLSSSSSAAAVAAAGRPPSTAGGSMAGILGGGGSSGPNDHYYKPPPAISPHYTVPTTSSSDGRRDVARPPSAPPALLYDKGIASNNNNLKMWSCNCGKVNRIVDARCKSCHNKRS